MQGINKARHVLLLEALSRMEMLLGGQPAHPLLQRASAYHKELALMHTRYEGLLDELSRPIDDYEDLYSEVRVQFLGIKLKELKKGLLHNHPSGIENATSSYPPKL